MLIEVRCGLGFRRGGTALAIVATVIAYSL